MTTLAQAIPDPSTARTEARRVLVLRSCRMPLFTETIAWIQQEWPGAQIDVLTSPGWDDQVRALGVARIHHYAGRSLGLMRNGVLLRRLRRERYDVVVIPQMNDSAEH